tara:strand:- start:68574 stop:68834 length:261 start_codon:yes stop_codon:yes gene_type:complete
MFVTKLRTIPTLAASAVLATSVSRSVPCQRPSPDAPLATPQTSLVLAMPVLAVPVIAMPMLAIQWGAYTPGSNPFGWITSADIDLS